MNQPVGPYDFWRDTLQPGLFGLYDRWTEQKPWPTPEQINAAVQNPGLLDREAMASYAVDMAQPFAAKLGGLLGHMPIPEGGLFGMTKHLALPMDEASRMARAREMGYDTVIYHGQSPKNLQRHGVIDEIVPNSGYAEDGAFFGAADQNTANQYAGRKGAVYPLMVRSQDFVKNGFQLPSEAQLSAMSRAEVDELVKQIDKWNDSLPPRAKVNFVKIGLQEAKKTGKEGVKVGQILDDPYGGLTNFAFPTDIYATHGPHVRSIFAAFDPAKKDSADLLAQWAALGLLGGGLGAGLLYNDEETY